MHRSIPLPSPRIKHAGFLLAAALQACLPCPHRRRRRLRPRHHGPPPRLRALYTREPIAASWTARDGTRTNSADDARWNRQGEDNHFLRIALDTAETSYYCYCYCCCCPSSLPAFLLPDVAGAICRCCCCPSSSSSSIINITIMRSGGEG